MNGTSDNDPRPALLRRALRGPVVWFDNGWPQANVAYWPGRGLFIELGAVAYSAWRRERPGQWPEVLDAFERDHIHEP